MTVNTTGTNECLGSLMLTRRTMNSKSSDADKHNTDDAIEYMTTEEPDHPVTYAVLKLEVLITETWLNRLRLLEI